MADEKKSTELTSPAGWHLPELSVEELEEISAYFSGHGGGTAKFTPRICPGPSCRLAHQCPLVRQQISLPINRQCFVELNLIRDHMNNMATELDLKPTDIFAITSIGSIATNNVIIMRALEMLSREDVVVDSFRALTPDGTPVFERKANPAIEIIAKMEKINQAIQSDLMATRKEKSKDQARRRISPTEQMQKLKEKLAASRKAIEDGRSRLMQHYAGDDTGEGEVIEAEFSVKEDPNGEVSQGDEGREQRREVRREEGSPVQEEREEEQQGQQVLKRDPRGFLVRE